jgi:hypothetical protein
MITCALHPDYLGYRLPTSLVIKPGCTCLDVYNDRTKHGGEYATVQHARMMGQLSRKPADERVQAEAQTCFCGRPALYIIRKHHQKDKPVCRLHRERKWPV